MLALSDKPRRDLVRRACRLEWLIAGWLTIEAGVAVGAGISAHSVSLIAFGADSGIELASAGVLLWRLTVELRRGDEFSQTVEERSRRIAGALLFALAAYVVAAAGYGLWRQRGQEVSVTGLVIAVVSIPVMYLAARQKIRIAGRIGSHALKADAAESTACAYLAGAVVAGLLAQLFFGAWWIDSATSLVIVGFLVHEGWEAWRGENCTGDAG